MCARPRFHANNVWKVNHTFLFWKRPRWYKNDNSHIVALISMERFRMFTHFCAASFSIEIFFYETRNTFLSRVLDVFTKLSDIHGSSRKLKVMSYWTLFVILLISAVICKQRLLHVNKIVKYLQNCKWYNIG